MAFIRNSFSDLALIFTVAVPYHARDSHYTIVQLADSQLAVYLSPLFPSFCTSSRKISFASCIIVYDILFHFIHVYIARGQEETTLGDNFLWKQKGHITLITGCMFQKQLCPLNLCTLFHDFIHVFRPWAGADNPLGPKF